MTTKVTLATELRSGVASQASSNVLSPQRRVAEIALLSILLWATSAPLSAVADTPLVGSTAPGFELGTLNGERVSLGQLRGRVVFLNLWATWCPPCLVELPELERLSRSYGYGLVILAVSVDKRRANVEEFVAEAKVESLTIGLDPESDTVALYDPEGMPASFLIDSQGVIRYEHIGFDGDVLQEYEDQIERLLGKGKEDAP